MAISVMSEQEIQRTNIREIEDVIALMPSLTLASGTTAANNALFMRGIGTVSVGIGVESDVAVIIDDIPIAVQFQAFRDLGRRGAHRGAERPAEHAVRQIGRGRRDQHRHQADWPARWSTAPATYLTDDNEWRVGASIGGRINDQFAMRIAANKTRMPGNFHNLTTAKDVNGSGGKTFMAKLQWNPIRNLDIDLTPHYNSQENSRGVTAVNGFFLRTGSAAAGNLVSTPAGLDRLPERQSAAAGISHILAGINVNDPEQPQRAPRLPDRDQLEDRAPA
jgi:iron complex outermembrane receptor protein